MKVFAPVFIYSNYQRHILYDITGFICRNIGCSCAVDSWACSILKFYAIAHFYDQTILTVFLIAKWIPHYRSRRNYDSSDFSNIRSDFFSIFYLLKRMIHWNDSHLNAILIIRLWRSWVMRMTYYISWKEFFSFINDALNDVFSVFTFIARFRLVTPFVVHTIGCSWRQNNSTRKVSGISLFVWINIWW